MVFGHIQTVLIEKLGCIEMMVHGFSSGIQPYMTSQILYFKSGNSALYLLLALN